MKARGVVTTGLRKPELDELCQIAREIDLEVDPDGLVEDRGEIIAEKLNDKSTGAVLTNAALESGTSDLSPLPPFSFIDIFSYLL